MITLDVIQGTDEWSAARCGMLSASNFDKVVTTTGEPSKQRQKYLYQLVGERIVGARECAYENESMRRGRELESEARTLYELLTDMPVQEVGLCYPDERKLVCCSPDGLVGEDGGLEIKCPSLPTHIEYVIGGKLPTEYIQQVQGNLYVTGRKWWSFMSYYPGIKPLIVRVERDEAFIAKLKDALEQCCSELEVLTERISA